jgi:hypothetical protein
MQWLRGRTGNVGQCDIEVPSQRHEWKQGPRKDDEGSRC